MTVTPMDRLPCGCQMTTVGDAFVYEPCTVECWWFAWVQEEITSRGMPITTLDLRREA